MKRVSLITGIALISIVILMGSYKGSTQSTNLSDAIIGRWFTKDYKGIVQIYKNTNGKYYGKITWLSEPTESNGQPKKDDQNPDRNLRNTPVVGLIILKDFSFKGEHIWDKGTIYDPENGKTYTCKMKLVKDNQLEIRGFIGISAIGRTEVWYKAK